MWLLKGTAYVLAEARRAELFLQLVLTETGEYWQVSGVMPLDAALLGLRRQAVLMPPEPPKRPSLRLEMTVVASRPDGRGGDVDLGVVREGGRLRSNDDLKVYFRTNADAYVYLVWVDPQGKASLQFPSRAAGVDNRVRGGVVHTAPEANKWYYLDRHPGIETLYLFASYEPLSDLAALLRQRNGWTGAGRSTWRPVRWLIRRRSSDGRQLGRRQCRSRPRWCWGGRRGAASCTAGRGEWGSS